MNANSWRAGSPSDRRSRLFDNFLMRRTPRITSPRSAHSPRRRPLCRQYEPTPVRADYQGRVGETPFSPVGAQVGAGQTWLDRSTETLRHFAQRLELDLVLLGPAAVPGRPVRTGDELARRLRHPTLFVPRPATGFLDPVQADVQWRRVLIVLEGGVPREPAVERALGLAEKMGVSSGTIVTLRPRKGAARGPCSRGPGWEVLSLPGEGDEVRSLLTFCQNHEVDLIILMAQNQERLAGSPSDTVGQLMQRRGVPLLAVPER